ncbi:unnamed protein product [Prorocentrum cordatum]|uniref:Uncharacterized protein n=1 Tax=Prorocentrum cordatum TaxID=2364126 RepID=A0ABN9SQ17_9DINO|nr:unnamed protein product [Polarella glacialis]
MSKRQYDLAATSFASALRALGERSSAPERIVVSGGEAAQERRMGLFTRTAEEQAGRPVYQNPSGQYLYAQSRRAAGALGRPPAACRSPTRPAVADLGGGWLSRAPRRRGDHAAW